jgi:hypothetical protein
MSSFHSPWYYRCPMERKPDLTCPFVRFRYENSETPLDVVETGLSTG